MIIISILIYFLILLVILVFNAYMIYRVWQIRIQGDKTPLAILIYLIGLGGITLLSLILILFTLPR